MNIEDVVEGKRYVDESSGLDVRVIFARGAHSVKSYIGYVLVQYLTGNKGCYAAESELLVPREEPRIYGMEGLLWITPRRLVPAPFDDIDDGYEVD